MTDYLKQAAAQLESGQAAYSTGQLEAAHRCYLEAARCLFEAADQAGGDLKQQRIRQARQLMAQAQQLEETLARRQAAQPPPPSPDKSPPLPAGAPRPEGDFVPAERPAVRFADVAGLAEAVAQIRLKLVYPFTHPAQAEKFGVRRGGGLLLYGPPGTGKTLLARAVAGEVEAPFFSVKPSEIMSKWVGEAEQNIQKLFAAARSYERAVIFIDEVEALVPKRRSSGSTVMQRLVPQILAELEGFEEKEGALLFIGATNEPWSLDPAVLRPGRFDEKIYVPLPDLVARRLILELNLRDRPLAPGVDLDYLAQALAGYSGADAANICRKACAIPFIEAVEQGVEREVSLADFEQVIAQVKPSVSPAEVRKYEKYAGASPPANR